jgi:hypothetical protein
LINAIEDLDSADDDEDGRNNCIQVASVVHQKLGETRLLREAARIISCRSLNELYAKTAHDEFCDAVPVNLFNLSLCLLIPVVFIFFANLLQEIFLLDEPTIELENRNEKVTVGIGKFDHDQDQEEDEDDDHQPAEAVHVTLTGQSDGVPSAVGSLISQSPPPSPQRSSRDRDPSPGSVGDDLALDDVQVMTEKSDVLEDSDVQDEEDEYVVDVVDVHIHNDNGDREHAASDDTILPIDVAVVDLTDDEHERVHTGNSES